MKAQQTIKQEKNQFNKSLGTGMKSVFNAKGRKFYILEHRTHSQKHKAGEVQEIIVDYVELGRDSKCQVRFGEDMATVSRRHASIMLEDNKWIIKHLSTSNQTIVNGRPVSKQWYLGNGDEIQLSAEGPKMGFIIPQNNTVNSLGLSKRLSLFRQQALRPYKRAISVLSIFLVIAILGATYGVYTAQKATKELYAFKKTTEQESEVLKNQLSESEEFGKKMEEKVKKLEGDLKKFASRKVSDAGANYNNSETSVLKFSALYPDIY